MEIKAVLFDLDQTLIDFMKMKRLSISNAVDAMIDAGLRMKKATAEKILFALYDRYGIEYQRIFQVFLRRTMKNIDYKILAAGISAYRRTKAAHLETYPHALSTLTELKRRGLRLAIISDAPRLQAWTRLADLKLLHLFDVVVTLGEAKIKKPAAAPFRRGLRELHLNPGEVLMVGDWPARDVEGARRLGIKTCWASYGTEPQFRPSGKKIRADYKIKDIAELLKIVS